MERALELDRMAIEEAGPNPERLAMAIHRQLEQEIAPVPVTEVAKALGIIEVRAEQLSNIEGALVTTPERGAGSILVNSAARTERQRFTIAHELGHFLNPWHRPMDGHGFSCTRQDIYFPPAASTRASRLATRHATQEQEANRFAVELLLPIGRLKPFLKMAPSLDVVFAIAQKLKVSREAVARRFVEKTDAPVAIAFTANERLRYGIRSANFPRLAIRKGDPLTLFGGTRGNSSQNDFEDAEPSDWLAKPSRHALLGQTYLQADGHAMTLLVLDNDDDGDLEEEADSDDWRGLLRRQ